MVSPSRSSRGLRGVTAWQKREGYENYTLNELAERGVEECFNHLSNVHDGYGFNSGELRACRLHARSVSQRGIAGVSAPTLPH